MHIVVGTKLSKAYRCSSLVEAMVSTPEALGSIPRTTVAHIIPDIVAHISARTRGRRVRIPRIKVILGYTEGLRPA